MGRPWRCQDCGKAFGKRLDRDNHRRVHTGDRPFQCEDCGTRFSQSQNLRTHIRTKHLGEKRHACPDCGKCFTRRRLLDCHTNAKHAGRRPFSCRQCPATFVYPEHVRKHEMMHEAGRDKEGGDKARKKPGRGGSVEKPQLSCSACCLSYRSRAALGRHRCRQAAATSKPVILCLPNTEGGAGPTQLCYAAYIGKAFVAN